MELALKQIQTFSLFVWLKNILKSNRLVSYFENRNNLEVLTPFFAALGCEYIGYGQVCFISQPFSSRISELGFQPISKGHPLHNKVRSEEELFGWPIVYHQRYNMCLVVVDNSSWDCLLLAIKLCQLNTNSNLLLRQYFVEIKNFIVEKS